MHDIGSPQLRNCVATPAIPPVQATSCELREPGGRFSSNAMPPNPRIATQALIPGAGVGCGSVPSQLRGPPAGHAAGCRRRSDCKAFWRHCGRPAKGVSTGFRCWHRPPLQPHHREAYWPLPAVFSTAQEWRTPASDLLGSGPFDGMPWNNTGHLSTCYAIACATPSDGRRPRSTSVPWSLKPPPSISSGPGTPDRLVKKIL